jgi:hypothetical protein
MFPIGPGAEEEARERREELLRDADYPQREIQIPTEEPARDESREKAAEERELAEEIIEEEEGD